MKVSVLYLVLILKPQSHHLDESYWEVLTGLPVLSNGVVLLYIDNATAFRGFGFPHVLQSCWRASSPDCSCGGEQGQVSQLFSDTSRGALVSPCGRLMSWKALMTAAKTQAHRDEGVLCIDQCSATFFQVWLRR